MFKGKKSQAGSIIGNFVLSFAIIVIVFGVLYGLTPVMVNVGAPTVANNDADILTRLLVFFLPVFAWVIWLFGSIYLLKKASNGEAIWE